MKCPQCGGPAPDTASFCPQCGAKLNQQDDEQSEGLAAGAARLMSRGGRDGRSRPEEELWSGTYSPKAMVEWAVGAGILTLVGVVAVAIGGGTGQAWAWLAVGVALVWALLGLSMLYRRMTVRYQLTTYRLFHEKGLLSRTRDRIEVIDIDDVTLRQGLIERMLNVGTIHVHSSDMTHGSLEMPGIEDARHVADLIDNTRRAERERRGLFMENV